jgi:phosphate transport system protein
MSEPTEGHIVRRYDADLQQLRLDLLEMGALVLDQLHLAVHSMVNGRAGDAHAVAERDDRVNARHIRIDEEAVKVIATRQPVASDLRVIMAISRATIDLERAGDEAKRIALQGMLLQENGHTGVIRPLLRDFRQMAQLTASMLRAAIDAFDRMDADAARVVIRRDADLDRAFDGALRRMVTVVMEDAHHLSGVIEAVFVIRSLERIGDHAKNIAESVVFLVEGIDIRHQPQRAAY